MIALRKYTEVFIETGSYLGDGIQAALDAGYSKVVSIELIMYYHNRVKERFKNNPKVRLVQGDSALWLSEVISAYNEPLTFWLDGHPCAANTAKGVCDFPILKELQHIQNHPIKEHVIMIDAVRYWKSLNQRVYLASVSATLRRINPNYGLSYLDGYEPNDILLAKV